MKQIRRIFRSALGVIALSAATILPVQAATVTWAGYLWDVNTGNGIGSGIVSGNVSNVSVDGSGDLHLKMTSSGGVWTGAELGTSSNLGFGSYYWVFSGPLTTFEPQVVLGGFTYGPTHGIGADGTNEIDVEFSKWNVSTNVNNGDFNIFPATGGTKGVNSSNLWNWTSGTVATCRIDWTPTSVTESVWSGVASTTASTGTAAVTWTYSGTSSTIPQAAAPFLFNLWTYGSSPTQTQDITVKSFQYTPLIPGTPTSVTATSSGTQIALGWTASSAATSYNVYRGYSAGTESATPIATGLTTLSYTDFGMTVGNRYYYKVAAVNNAGISAMSSEVSAVPPGSNIAPSGTGYLWAKNTTATSNSNQTASTGVNDSNLTTSVNVCPDGEAGAVKWEGAGVVWSAATHTITSASFINGANDGGGNGYLQASCQLQFTTDGTTWTSSGWTCSPAYPNSSSAFSQTYTFSGTPATGVKGARIVGATGSSSWRWQVKEVQFTGL